MFTLVIPTYNERLTIEPLLDRVAAVRLGWPEELEVLVMDDGSTDGTIAAAEAALARLRLGRVVQRHGQPDLAQAVLEGIRQARGEMIGVMDADLSHPPELLPSLAKAVQAGQDVVVASRYVSGACIQTFAAWRWALSRLANWLARPLTPVADATSGYFVARAEVVRSIAPAPRGFKILLEILVTQCVHRVQEVPYQFTERAAGQSKLRWSVCASYGAQLLRLGWHRLRHPCRHRRGASPRSVSMTHASFS